MLSDPLAFLLVPDTPSLCEVSALLETGVSEIVIESLFSVGVSLFDAVYSSAGMIIVSVSSRWDSPLSELDLTPSFAVSRWTPRDLSSLVHLLFLRVCWLACVPAPWGYQTHFGTGYLSLL